MRKWKKQRVNSNAFCFMCECMHLIFFNFFVQAFLTNPQRNPHSCNFLFSKTLFMYLSHEGFARVSCVFSTLRKVNLAKSPAKGTQLCFVFQFGITTCFFDHCCPPIKNQPANAWTKTRFAEKRKASCDGMSRDLSKKRSLH